LYSLHERVGPLIKRFSMEHAPQGEIDDAEKETGVNNFDAWADCWRPVLTAMAACLKYHHESFDLHVISLIQKSLLHTHGNLLSAQQWNSVFHELLYPILTNELERQETPVVINPVNKQLMENNKQNEVEKLNTLAVGSGQLKIATIKMVSKVFLFRLELLSSLPNFEILWLQLLQFLNQFAYYTRRFQHLDVCKTVVEIIKDTILVMKEMSLFSYKKDLADEKQLRSVTLVTINKFSNKDLSEKLNILINS
jgi:hypothetical protein